jgi:hypothetical protein
MKPRTDKESSFSSNHSQLALLKQQQDQRFLSNLPSLTKEKLRHRLKRMLLLTQLRLRVYLLVMLESLRAKKTLTETKTKMVLRMGMMTVTMMTGRTDLMINEE